MKAKIRGFEVEGEPKEIAQLIKVWSDQVIYKVVEKVEKEEQKRVYNGPRISKPRGKRTDYQKVVNALRKDGGYMYISPLLDKAGLNWTKAKPIGRKLSKDRRIASMGKVRKKYKYVVIHDRLR